MAARELLSGEQMRRAMARIAHEILERNGGAKGLALVGIRSTGVPIAERLASLLAGIEGHGVECLTRHRVDDVEGHVLPGLQHHFRQLSTKLLFLVSRSRLKAPFTRDRRVSFPDMELVKWLLTGNSRHLVGLLQQ